MSNERVPLFTPIITEEREKNGPFITVVSVDGPNGTGKTSILNSLLPLQQVVNSINAIDLNHDAKLAIPVFGLQEPPSVPVGQGRKDTYRSLAKSHISKDDKISEGDLKDPLTQSGIFLWGRRRLEEKMVQRPPLKACHYEDDNEFLSSINTKPQRYVFREEQEIRTESDLTTVGGLICVKDRATASTCVYQGSDREKGSQVLESIEEAYNSKFLLKEDLTIIITPDEEKNLNRSMERDLSEPDAYAGLSDYGKYLALRNLHNIFSNRIVYLRNDPSGKRGDVTIPVLLSSLLITATEERKPMHEPIPIGREFEVKFPLQFFDYYLDSLTDLNMPHDFRIRSLKIRNNVKEEFDCNVVCGDVAITNFDRVEGVATVLIRPSLEDELRSQ